jgi:integrase/recombinase XerD
VNTAIAGPWIRRFLLEHLIGERNLARNTQRSYRDTMRLLLPFAAKRVRKAIDALLIDDLSAQLVAAFLLEVESSRACSVATRNQRLAAIHAFARFVGLCSPEHIAWSGAVRSVPFKKATKTVVVYLDQAELNAVLAAAEGLTPQRQRDHALLLFLYNTGARADEAAHVLIRDLSIGLTAGRDPCSVLIRGKGNRLRRCPLWPRTIAELSPLIRLRSPDEHVFLNRRGEPLTRFGVYATVRRTAAKGCQTISSLRGKTVSPHTIRHTTAMHLLRSGVDINTIRAWLGHVSLDTTNVYAEADLEMKARALATCEVRTGRPRRTIRTPEMMEFLQSL